MSLRDAAIRAFLRQHGIDSRDLRPLAQDASFRRYWRVGSGSSAAVLMDAPPPEDVRPFLNVARHLGERGISVPEVFAADPEAGFVLLEDLGDSLFPELLDSPDAPAMFDAAVDLLVAVQRAPVPANLPRWGIEEMSATAESTVLDWWWPAAFGTPAPAAARAAFAAAITEMLAPLAAEPPVFVHRDYFVGNLIWLPAREGVRRVGLLDFQSAAGGHPAYDLASLIEDSRRDIPAALARRCVDRYLAAQPELDAPAFLFALAICNAQRHLRVAAQWVRLARRDGRTHYLAYGPTTWRLLEQALRHEAASPLAQFFDRWIPPERRGNPPDLAA